MFNRIRTRKDPLKKILNRYGLIKNLTLFDVGAHKGQTALYLSKVFPNSMVYSFEPNPELFAELTGSTKYRPQIKCINLALGRQPGCGFLSTPESDLCGQIMNAPADGSHAINISSLDFFCQQNNIKEIDILKIDVEGFELEVLKGGNRLLQKRKIEAILLECDFNSEDTQHTYFFDAFNFLKTKNFGFHGLFDIVIYGKDYGIGFCNALFVKGS